MGDLFERAKKTSEEFRKRLEESKKTDIKSDLDFDSPLLDSSLKDVSFGTSNLSNVLNLADRIKKKNLKKYQKEFHGRVSDYYVKLRDKADAKWESSKKKLPDYRNYLRQLFILTLFQSLIDKDITPELVTRIGELEVEMRKHIETHPKELNVFLKTADSETADRSVSLPGFDNYVENTLELLTVANPKVQRLDKKNKVDSFTINYNDEIWEFVFFGQITIFDEPLITVRSQKTPEKMAVISFGRLVEFLEKDNFAGVVSIIDGNYESEKKYADLLAGFDLPRSGQMEYIRLSLDKFDTVITPTFFGSIIFAEKLRQFYPNLHIASPVLTSNPKESLLARVSEAYAAGTRQFFIDIYAHGSEKTLFVGASLNADDLISIAKEFPDAAFHFSTIGCYGGGLREGFLQAMEREPELRQRISLFLQTKPDLPNAIQGRILKKAGDKIKEMAPGDLTLYQMTLLKSLSKGKTFGEAIIDADKESKVRMYLDPEAIIEGQLITEFKGEGTDKSA